MGSLTQQLMKQLSGGGLSEISGMNGADESATGSLLSASGPLLTSALAKNAATPDGAQALSQALAKDHDGSILDDVGGFPGDPQAANGAGVLGHMLDGKEPAIEQGLARGAGLDAGQVGQLLPVVAPLLMGLLGRQQRSQGLNASGLSASLGGERQAQEQASPDIMKMATGLLDTDKDGSPGTTSWAWSASCSADVDPRGMGSAYRAGACRHGARAMCASPVRFDHLATHIEIRRLVSGLGG